MQTLRFIVGVEDYRFTMQEPCSVQPTHAIAAQLWFELEGDFLTAARTDSLSHTVDYDALCQAIIYDLKAAHCGDLSALFAIVTGKLQKVSPLVTGGYVKMKICCHDTFLMEAALL